MYCKLCQDKAFTLLVGRCACGGEKNTAHAYCEKCAVAKNCCRSCGKRLPLVSKKTL